MWGVRFPCRGYKHTTCWLFSSFRLEDQTKKLHKDMKKSTEADLGVFLPDLASSLMLAAWLCWNQTTVPTLVLMLQLCCCFTSCWVRFYSFGVFVLVFVEFLALFFLFWAEYLGDGRRHGLWLIVSCGGGGVRGFFISSALCSRIWMSASSKHRSCQVLIILNEFHLLRRFTFPPADTETKSWTFLGCWCSLDKMLFEMICNI